MLPVRDKYLLHLALIQLLSGKAMMSMVEAAQLMGAIQAFRKLDAEKQKAARDSYVRNALAEWMVSDPDAFSLLRRALADHQAMNSTEV